MINFAKKKNCSTCNDQKADGHASPAVLQINNPSECVIFHKTTIPASMGNETTIPPVNGAYKNMLVYYEGSGAVYLYSSDGVPTLINYTDYVRLINKPSINGVTLVGNKSLADIGAASIEDLAAKQDKLTPTQIAATNSGITAYKVTTYDGYASQIAAKQDALSAAQLAAANSGITSSKVSTYDGYAAQIAAKADLGSLATVATTGSYNDLTNKPTIDTALSSTSTNAVENRAIYAVIGDVESILNTLNIGAGV